MNYRILPFTIEIENIFHLSDNTKAIIGKLLGGGNIITPCETNLYIDGELISKIVLEAERMPGQKMPKDYRIVVTSQEVPINPKTVKNKRCILVYE